MLVIAVKVGVPAIVVVDEPVSPPIVSVPYVLVPSCTLLAVAVAFDNVMFARPVIVALRVTQHWPVPVIVKTLLFGEKSF